MIGSITEEQEEEDDADGGEGGGVRGGTASARLAGGVLTLSTVAVSSGVLRKVEAAVGLESATPSAGSAASASASVWKSTVKATRTLAAVTVAETAPCATPASSATLWRIAVSTLSVKSETVAAMTTSMLIAKDAGGAGGGTGAGLGGGGNLMNTQRSADHTGRLRD